MFRKSESKDAEKIKSLTEENKRLRYDICYLQSYKTQLIHDNSGLQKELNWWKEKKKELERSFNKAINDFAHNSKDNVIATLKDDIKRLQSEKDEDEKEIAELRTELDTLRTRISKVAGDKLTDGNPGIADLSDPNRPMKLAEMCSIVYDNKWTDAYEHTEGDDRTIAAYLLKLFVTTWKFCNETSVTQMEQLEKALMLHKQDDNNYATPPECLKSLKEIRKQFAREILPNLNQEFKSTKMQVKDAIQPYLEGCMELCWYGAMCDPPVDFVFEATDQVEDFKVYTKSGKRVDYVVWPAMYLCKHGPLLYKGVAQFRD